MSTPTCHHVLANGALCQAAPLRHRDYCRFHLQQIGRRMKAARMRARQQPALLKLPLLEDLYSVQVALMQLADAIAYQEIEPQHARLLTTVLRLAMQNLKSKQAWGRSSRFQLVDTEAAPTTWDSFEQEHDLPADLDLSLDPEVAFPPTKNDSSGAPLNPAVGLSGRESAGSPCGPIGMFGNDDPLRAKVSQVLRNAETPVPGSPAHVTADDVDILDVYEREGNDAMMKCIAEQQRSRTRRERRVRRPQYEEMARNHNIQLAAKKLVGDQRKAEAAQARQHSANASEAAQPGGEADRKLPQSEVAMQRQQQAAEA